MVDRFGVEVQSYYADALERVVARLRLKQRPRIEPPDRLLWFSQNSGRAGANPSAETAEGWLIILL